MTDPNRQTGRTTEQICTAPHGAVYIVSSVRARFHVEHLAIKCNRRDLIVRTPSYIRDNMRSTNRRVVVDHACCITCDEWEAVTAHNSMIDQ
jgi:hypothetical protein